MLRIDGLTKVYNNGAESVVALHELNVTFPDKGLMVILGKSGCGKTTLINMIGGLDKPTSGQVIVNGKDITTLNGGSFDAYRNTYIGVVFQEFNLIDDISVYDNIEMSLKLAEKNADVNTVDEVLSMVGLSNLGYRKPNELSGGQKQRVALARTLIKKPEIILADEPTGALDVVTSEEVFESLKKIAETKLVIIVTHNRELAFTYGERVLEMTDGRFVSDRQREIAESDRTKVLSEHLVQLSATSKMDKESLNELLDKQEKDKEIYLGISYDKDRIALAYSDTVDSFYEKSETSAYHETGAVDATTDRTFALSKGKLRFKDALTLARKNIKRTKKRFRLLTVLSTISMMCVIVSIVLSGLSVFQMVAGSSFGTGSQGFVELRRSYSYYYEAIDKAEMENIKPHFGDDAVIAGTTDVSFIPMFADKVVEFESEYYDGFAFTHFSSAVDGASPADFGYRMMEGSTEPTNTREITISDFAAYELCKSGFVGKNTEGVTGIYHPESARDLIGYSVRMQNSTVPLKIAGIFLTNYEDYSSLAGSAESGTTLAKMQSEFTANNNFAYKKVFGIDGLGSELRRTFNYSGNDSYYLSNTYTSYYVELNDPHAATDLSLVPDGQYYTTTGELKELPEQLSGKEIIIPLTDVRNLVTNYSWSRYNRSWALSDNYDVSLMWNDATYQACVSEGFTLSSTNYDTGSVRNMDVEIAGFVTSINSQAILLSPALADEISTRKSELSYQKVIVSRGANALALENSLKSIYELDSYDRWLFGSATAPINSVGSLTNMLSVLQPIFFWVAVAFIVMSFLIVMNFMSQSVRFRLKEIAVLRLVGAKRSDIASIFLTEGGIITLRVGILANILAIIAVTIINSIMSDFMAYLSIGAALLSFNFLHVIAVFAITALFTAVASLIPILGVTLKKPIEAIKLGGN